jgi:hypothetical protein
MTGIKFIKRTKKGFFSSLLHPDQLWGPSSLLFNGYQGLSSGVMQPRHEADHSLPFHAKVKNAQSYTSTSPYVFMAWCLLKQM